MAKSYASTVIDAPADEVWARIRDFNGLPVWHGGMVASSEIEEGKAGDQVGGVRSFTLTNGAHLREQLVGALGRRAVVHLRLPEASVRGRRELPRDDSRHAGHRREQELRRVVDDVRLRSRPARPLAGLLRERGLPGRLRRAEGALRGVSAAGVPRRGAARAVLALHRCGAGRRPPLRLGLRRAGRGRQARRRGRRRRAGTAGVREHRALPGRCGRVLRGRRQGDRRS